MIKVWIDGRIVPPEQAVVPVFDRGFLYGDSVYEVLRTVRGQPLDLPAHLARLARSAGCIECPLPMPPDGIAAAVHATLREAGNPDSYIRIVVTRGGGEIDLDPAAARDPRLVVLVKPIRMPPETCYREGVQVCLVAVHRTPRDAVDPSVKSGNYLNNILALAEARKRGGYEAIMCDHDGFLAEGASSNVFLVSAGEVATPSLDTGILEGVTRARVLALCAGAGLPAREQRLRPERLRGAGEAFLTSSVRGVVPITRVDGAPVGGGRVGPITRRLMDLYAKAIGLP